MVFLSEGFSSITVTQLAASVGCSRRSLYFSQPGILDDLGMTRDEASHEMTDIVLRSLLHPTIHSPKQQASSIQ
jgi:hypothetical protein